MSGFTHSPLYPVESPSNGPGRGKELWVDNDGTQRTQPVAFSSPLVADIDRNPANGLEVIVAGGDAIVYLFGADGTQRWHTNVMAGTSNYPCEVASNDFLMYSSPAAGDLDGSGGPLSIVVGYGTSSPSSCEGGVVALDGATGAVKWRYSMNGTTTGGTPYPNGPEGLHGVLSTPALSDTDGDGRMEIGFGGLDRKVYLLNFDGSRRWFYDAADTVKSSPAFFDVDGDGVQEMIIGTDITERREPPRYDHGDGGFVYAFPTTDRGGEFLRFPTTTDQSVPYLWRVFFDQVVTSSPVLGDVLASNPGPEIVIGSGCYFPLESQTKRGNYLRLLRPSDGTILETLEMPGCTQATAAVGDLDGNGRLDIVGISSFVPGANGSQYSSVVAWEPDTSVTTPKWIRNALNSPNVAAGEGNDPDGGTFNAPTLADIDGNGSVEVLVSNSWAVHVLNGETGDPLTCQSTDCGSQVSLFAWWSVLGAPAVADVNGDGAPEVVAGGSNFFMPGGSGGVPPHGTVYVWTGPYGIQSPPGNAAPYFAPWPQYHGGPQRNGLGLPALVVSPTSLELIHLQGSGSTAQASIRIQNVGGGSIDWTATASDGRVTVTPSSGTVSSQATLTVSVDTSGFDDRQGSVPLGTLTVTAPGVEGSPVSIPVSIQVVPVRSRVHLPAVIQ